MPFCGGGVVSAYRYQVEHDSQTAGTSSVLCPHHLSFSVNKPEVADEFYDHVTICYMWLHVNFRIVLFIVIITWSQSDQCLLAADGLMLFCVAAYLARNLQPSRLFIEMMQHLVLNICACVCVCVCVCARAYICVHVYVPAFVCDWDQSLCANLDACVGCMCVYVHQNMHTLENVQECVVLTNTFLGHIPTGTLGNFTTDPIEQQAVPQLLSTLTQEKSCFIFSGSQLGGHYELIAHPFSLSLTHTRVCARTHTQILVCFILTA